MSAFSGKQYRGAMSVRRALKRQEAEERNARTPEHWRRAFRLAVAALAAKTPEPRVVYKTRRKGRAR